MSVQPELPPPRAFLLVDDVVPRGATLLGAANRLHAAYPAVPIRAFAAIRTVSDPEEFCSIVEPAMAKIQLFHDGTILRFPV